MRPARRPTRHRRGSGELVAPAAHVAVRGRWSMRPVPAKARRRPARAGVGGEANLPGGLPSRPGRRPRLVWRHDGVQVEAPHHEPDADGGERLTLARPGQVAEIERTAAEVPDQPGGASQGIVAAEGDYE